MRARKIRESLEGGFDWEARPNSRRAQRRRRRRAARSGDAALLLSARAWRKRRAEFEKPDDERNLDEDDFD